jgi:hypothetical protein
MKKKWVVAIHIVVALVTAWSLGYSQAAGKAVNQVAAAGTVPSAFNYQGVLRENNQPVTGTRSMVFGLYTDSGCSGTALATDGPIVVTVTNGLFNVTLAFYYDNFNGQDLWLSTSVGGTAVGCQELLATPYALSLRPGAIISTNSDTYALNLTNAGNTSTAGGLHAQSHGEYAAAVWGEGTGLDTYGVYGSSSNGYAIYSAGRFASSEWSELNLNTWGLTARNSPGLTFTPQVNGWMQVSTTTPGTYYIVLPISAFTQIFGTDTYIRHLMVHYYVSGGGKITATQVVTGYPSTLDYYLLINEIADHAATSPEIYVTWPSEPRPNYNYSSYVQFTLQFSGAGSVVFQDIAIGLIESE